MIQGLLLRLQGNSMTRKVEKSEEAAGEAGKGDDEPVPWVPVLTVFGPAQAQFLLLAARLNDAGIPAHTRQEAVSSALPFTVGALSRIDLMVPKPMVEKALGILEDLGAFEEEDT